MKYIEGQYGKLNGIIHSAGVIRDDFLIKKTGVEIEDVLSPKVKGLVNLDDASRGMKLDIFILFSSIAGVMGNAGQADYSAANAFMDEYAKYRNKLTKKNERQGRMLSINWPLWQEGGMKVSEENEKIMMLQTGMTAIQTENGIRTLYQAITLGKDQVMVIQGNRQKILEVLLRNKKEYKKDGNSRYSKTFNMPLLREKITYKIRALFGEISKIDTKKIEIDEPLQSYGIDSIMIAQFNHKLSEIFGDFSKTLFYEYRNLEAIVEYFIKEYPKECINWVGIGEETREMPEMKLKYLNISDIPPKLTSYKTVKKTANELRIMTKDETERDSIAIIGISGRFPQAKNVEEYWKNLKEGRNCITEIPDERWQLEEFFNPDFQEAMKQGKSYCKWGGFLESFADFDPLFFNISPRDAVNIDPQERVFLEECWKALEDAGYTSTKMSPELRQRTAVFGGVTKQGFILHKFVNDKHSPNTSFASMVNRVSYYLDLQGPSMPIDTMCSSSLVAIHEGCEYILQGKGELAIVGGVNLYLHPSTYIVLSLNQMISDSPKKNAFSAGGKGFVPGESVGVVILKSLKKAIKDSDSIYSVIRGTAVNHVGRTNSYMSPDPNQQAAVIKLALAQNNLDPRTISYIEAAANGSEMGDAIELNALTKVFSNRSGTEGSYKIGSVKPNIGHSESSSGMSQLLKVILSLKNKTLIPTIQSENLNPNINFNELPFKLQMEISEWSPVKIDGFEIPRRAGITGIGAGGVNAHIVVEEYIPEITSVNILTDIAEQYLFILSAKSLDILEEYVKRWIDYFKLNKNTNLENITYTLQIGREDMAYRLAIIINNQDVLLDRLILWLKDHETKDNCYYGDKNTSQRIICKEMDKLIETRDLNEISRLWVSGNTIQWVDMYKNKILSKVSGLPTYPFKRRKYWINSTYDITPYDEAVNTDSGKEYVNKAVEFYSYGADSQKKDFQTEYLTFCPFENRIPGFSISRVILNPEKYPAETELMRKKQIEMRQVLFYKEDFSQIKTLLDIGCGYGTDVIQIAALYPHIQTHGYTITGAQAELGNKRINQMNLSSQVKIFNRDSSKDKFSGYYDIVIGIEVTFHIRNKHELFQNISGSLNTEGKLLLMDYITNLKGAIVDHNVEISIPTKAQWADILSKHFLVIDEIIDVSSEIANFLHDEELEENIKDLPNVVKDTYRNYANQSVSLDKGWISYCLFKIKKNLNFSESDCFKYNENKISNMMPYKKALVEMLNIGHIPYPIDENIKKEYFNNPINMQISNQENRNQTAINIDEIKGVLENIFYKELGLQKEDIAEAESLKALGIGSMNVVLLMEAINTKFGFNMPTSIIFETYSFDLLTKYIADHLQEHQNKQREMGTEVIKIKHLIETPIKDQALNDDIAIIGLSCRCAGADGSDEFWDIISQGKQCIQEITDQKWLDFFKSNSKQKVPSKYGALGNIDYFDPLFFNISPIEAQSMDVAQRIILEECYRSFEDAGYTPEMLQGQQVGTFIGTLGGSSISHNLSHFALLGNDTSILASRIAYHLDLKGPALAINTACSSSLVAIDIACQKLKNHDIDLAIAGGITIYTYPAPFILMNNAGMLSPTGECRPFDNEADGIVVGDGVGIVVLKRLQNAVQEGDYIYGVIRGSGTNQDGKTAGITVPSFLSQSQLQESIYRKNKIPVENIQYVETHGTATKLGDPIEIHALTNSFSKFISKKGFCAIGSLKGNIGHTTAAAGVLSMIKILLSMKNEQIPPSINFVTGNEHIDFNNSPFYVNTALKEWPVNSNGKRLAAVSSFGFSGTNAHAVIESYTDSYQESTLQYKESMPGLFILSAKTQEALKSYAVEVKEFIQNNKNVNFNYLLYTFQIARKSMDYRLAVLADTKEVLILRLNQYIEGNISKSKDIYTGNIIKKGGVNINDTEEGIKFIQNLLQNNKINKLADLWVNGNQIDWRILYKKGSVKKLTGLPTYPFMRERYRIEISDEVQRDSGTYVKHIHPLLHENTSSLVEHRFSSVFTGDEFFITDHIINGRKLVPEVIYLEMARAAVETASELDKKWKGWIRLMNVVWVKQVVIDKGPMKLNIRLIPGEEGAITYEVYSKGENDVNVVHNQGTAEIIEAEEETIINIKDLQSRKWDKALSPEEFYAAFSKSGIEYGPGCRGIDKIYSGEGGALAKIKIPASVQGNWGEYILHPGIMDSALQAVLGLLDHNRGGGEMQPSALEGLEIIGCCVSSMWAVVRQREEGKGNKFDVDLCDEAGKICVRLKGLSLSIIESKSELGKLMLEPERKEGADALLEEIRGALTRNISKLLIIKIETIDMDRELSEYGFDSIITMSLVKDMINNFDLDSVNEGEALLKYIIENNPTINDLSKKIGNFSKKKDKKPIITSNDKINLYLQENNISNCLKDNVMENSTLVETEITSLLGIIAENTGLQVSSLSLNQTFNEIRITPNIMMSISRDILRKFYYPYISPESEKKIVKYITNMDLKIGALSEFIKARELSNKDLTQFNLHINEINLNQKTDQKNILITDISLNEIYSGKITGKLSIDETHSFFFDHSLDHVSGIQLTEAMSQLIKASVISRFGLDPLNPLFIPEAGITFKNYCRKEKDTWVNAYIKPQIEKDSIWFDTEVIQDDLIIATGRFNLKQNNCHSEIIENNMIKPKNLISCNSQIVNKNNSYNVLISEIQNKGDEIWCYLLLGSESSYFNDFPGEFVDTVILMEACRQSFRAFCQYLSSKLNIETDIKGLVPILKDIKIKIKQPIKKSYTVILKKLNMNIENVGRNNIMELKGSILLNNIEIGFYEIKSLLLEESFILNYNKSKEEKIGI